MSPRPPRHCVPGVVYHLISRFVAREFFIASELERREYLALLGAALSRTGWRCLSYAVMSNHIHLAMVAGVDPLADWLRLVHSPFAEAVNQARRRIGALFVRGPKAILVPDARVLQLIAYIHNNPVRAGVADRARDSTWTSHRVYVGLDAAPPWLDVDEGLRRAQAVRGEDFDRLVMSAASHPVLGRVQSDRHLESLVDAYERARCAELRAQVSRPVVAASQLVELVARELEIPPSQLRSRRRGVREVYGRGVVIACGVRAGCTTRELALALHVTPQAVTKVLRDDRAPGEADAIVARVMTGLVDARPADAGLIGADCLITTSG